MYYAWHRGTRTPVIQTNPDYVPWYLQEQLIWAPSAGSITPTSEPPEWYRHFWNSSGVLLFVLGTNPFMSSARSVLGTCCALSSGTCLHKLFSGHPKVAHPWDTTGLSYWSGEAVTTRQDVRSHPLLHCLLFKFLLQVPLLPSPPTNTTDPTLPGFSYSLLAILIGTTRPPGSQSWLVAIRARIQIASFSAFFLYNQLKILWEISERIVF